MRRSVGAGWSRRFGALPPRSVLAVDLAPMVNVEHVNRLGGIVDPVHDSVSAAPGAVTPGEWSKKRLPDSVGIDGKGVVTELDDRSGY